MEYKKISIWISYLMQFLIVVFIFFSLYQTNLLYVLLGIAYLFMTFLPLIIKRKWNIHLPWILNFLIVLSLYLNIGGVFWGWYDNFSPYYDKIYHVLGSFTAVLMGFTLMVILDKFSKIKINKNMVILFIIMATLSFGALWEMGEFVLDKIVATTNQKGLEDTMYDLIFDFIGGLIVSLLIWFKFDFIKKSVILNE